MKVVTKEWRSMDVVICQMFFAKNKNENKLQ